MKYDVDAMRENISKISSGGGFWKAPAGKTKVRILPGTVGSCDPGAFYRTIQVHKIDLGEGIRSFRVAPGRWDAFEAAADIFQTHGMTEQSRSCRKKISFALNLCPDGEREVYTWQCSGKIIKKLIGFIVDEDFGDFTDPKHGYCITVDREGEGFATRYDVIPSKTTGKLPEGWEGMANDLRMCDGDAIESRKAIALLASKFESDYDDLALELMQLRKKHVEEIQERKERKPKAKAKSKAKSKLKRRVVR